MLSHLLIPASFVIVLVAGLRYWHRLQNVKVPKFPVFELILGVAALVLLVFGLLQSAGWFGISLAIVVVSFCALFIISLILSRLPEPQNELKPGGKAGNFTLPDADNNMFTLYDAGSDYVLLKLFRGFWCPYCGAELQMYNALRRDFEKIGVRIVAVSSDTVEEAARMKRRRVLGIVLLSDVRLDVIRQYGLVHENALATVRGPVRDLAIPTTILIDRKGTIRWIDIASDFRCRTNPGEVLQTIRTILGGD